MVQNILNFSNFINNGRFNNRQGNINNGVIANNTCLAETCNLPQNFGRSDRSIESILGGKKKLAITDQTDNTSIKKKQPLNKQKDKPGLFNRIGQGISNLFGQSGTDRHSEPFVRRPDNPTGSSRYPGYEAGIRDWRQPSNDGFSGNQPGRTGRYNPFGANSKTDQTHRAGIRDQIQIGNNTTSTNDSTMTIENSEVNNYGLINNGTINGDVNIENNFNTPAPFLGDFAPDGAFGTENNNYFNATPETGNGFDIGNIPNHDNDSGFSIDDVPSILRGRNDQNDNEGNYGFSFNSPINNTNFTDLINDSEPERRNSWVERDNNIDLRWT